MCVCVYLQYSFQLLWVQFQKISGSTADWVSFSVCVVVIKEAHTVFYDFAHLHPQLKGFSFLHSLANPISFFLWFKALLAEVRWCSSFPFC